MTSLDAVAAVAAALRAEAAALDERRLLVLAGGRDRCYDAAAEALDAAGIDRGATTLLGPKDRLDCERVEQHRAVELLGTTREAVAIDCHDALRPNAVGRVAGAVDGGGLLLLLTPPLDEWPERRDGFDESLAVPPFEAEDVTGHFRRRFVETLRAHRGVGILDLDGGVVEDDGLTDPAPRLIGQDADATAASASGGVFPAEAYEACLTDDQADALNALEALAGAANDRDDAAEASAVVIESDRGRGKSSAAGLAAGSLVADGADVLVTAPEFRSVHELFARAEALLDRPSDGSNRSRSIDIPNSGSLTFAEPADAAERAGDADAVIVDEAAALSVGLLERFLDADRVAFATTVHGYEGAGRGFSVRFRDRLDEGRHEVIEATLSEPIRYAPGDPVEVWAFDALLLDARPPVEQLVADADPETATRRRLDAEELLADPNLLRETFGLLVLAHYRTEPNDLARLLDAPNLAVEALLVDGHVVSVALLAREGGLSADLRARMYDGERVRGNMLPDVLTTQLRDEDAAIPVGWRVLRIATHHAARSRGLGSELLSAVRERASAAETPDGAGLDWLGVGYGATPELLGFWSENGFSTVHLSTTRNDASGEYSAIMLDPLTDAGRDLRDRTAARFARRIGSVLSDRLADLDPDVARAALRAVDAEPQLELTDWEWRVVVGSSYGPGMFDVSPRPFRRLAVRYFSDTESQADAEDRLLDDRKERLLILRVLQARDWETVEDLLGFHSSGQCMRALGAAFQPLVDRYGGEVALAERERYD
ncbi:tRNA(Met) cytidine acetyltransferase [Natronoarchaeum philippinense]|uniref:tRNA(Met) cytidine acetyltransferase TmcA n=1 Tax=Natronoarchaeum philippinense TaxID=558529 RepID=A0A285N3Z0_NATPI|nr:tRNA(Met) cytidine acetyltransferase TmcA [Natronoarchaeum philippinense]SNZ04038.1 tRNA(Met) cytidine acetyltransferase [Natronoarchaeum philippinense]